MFQWGEDPPGGAQSAVAAVVEGHLLLLEAKARGVEVTLADVERFIQLEAEPAMRIAFLQFEQLFGHQAVIKFHQMVQTTELMKGEILPQEILGLVGLLPTDDDLLDFYLENRQAFLEPLRMRIGIILLDNEEESARVLERLEGGDDFSVVAREHSMDELTAREGGLVSDPLTIGQIKSTFPPEVADTLSLMEEGSWSGPFQYPVGIDIEAHLFVTMVGRKEEVEHSFEEVIETVRSIVTEMRFMPHYQRWIVERLNEQGLVFDFDLFGTLRLDLLGMTEEFPSSESTDETPLEELESPPVVPSDETPLEELESPPVVPSDETPLEELESPPVVPSEPSTEEGS